ncbi:MAG: RidA family protein [Caulobacteraceae bacterium]
MESPAPAVRGVHRDLLPEGWKRPSGYSNGVVAEGRTVYVAGQIGWDVEGRFPPTLAEQVRQALANIVAVLGEAGAGPEHLVRLTWYVVDIESYNGALREIGQAYKAVVGSVYPPMTLVQVVRLVEAAAQVEIEATAVVPPSTAA